MARSIHTKPFFAGWCRLLVWKIPVVAAHPTAGAGQLCQVWWDLLQLGRGGSGSNTSWCNGINEGFSLLITPARVTSDLLAQ